METIKNFFNHINYRLSSPFIFSFVISWLFCNWRVPIGLILYDTALLKTAGYGTYNNLIAKNVTWCSGFFYPLIGGLLYTILNPIVSSWIQEFYTYIQKTSEERQIEILKGGKISIDKYITLRSNLEKKEQLLETVIDTESNTLKELSEKNNENQSLKIELNNVRSSLESEKSEKNKIIERYHKSDKELNELQRAHVRFTSLSQLFNGNWICEFQFNEGPFFNRDFEPFYIEDDIYFAHGSKKFYIKDISFHSDFKTLKFKKQLVGNSNSFSQNTLIKISDNYWYGTEVLFQKNVISYVRYYSQAEKPETLYIIFQADEIREWIPLEDIQMFQRKFKEA